MSKIVNHWTVRGTSALSLHLAPSEDWPDEGRREIVPLYTLRFFVDSDEPAASEEIECATDGEAINAVNDRGDSRAIQLWQGERMILWWPARPNLPTRRHRPRAPFTS